MPVEHVVLIHLHQVEVLLDDLLADEVPAGVDEDPTVSEPWTVIDLSTGQEILNLPNSEFSCSCECSMYHVHDVSMYK